jgi:uncharacterized membrane protein HdeD (DUF308 family)
VIGAPWRRRAALVLAVLTAVTLAAAAIAGYVRYELLDASEFSARATAALDDGDVRAELADRAVQGIAGGVAPDVLAIRPLVTSALAALVDTDPFRRVFARALADQHRALFYGNAHAVIDLEYAGTLLHEALRGVSPRVANAIPRGTEPQLVELDEGDARLTVARTLSNLADWWWPLSLCALAAAVSCAVLAGRPRAALAHVAAAVSAAGIAVAGIVTVGGWWVVDYAAGPDDERTRAAVRAIWHALLADLRTTGLIAAVGGLVVAGLSARRPAFTLAWLRGAMRSPSRPARIARGLILVLLGAAAIVEPALGARVVLVALGFALLLLGIAELRGRPRPATLRGPAASVAAAPGSSGVAGAEPVPAEPASSGVAPGERDAVSPLLLAVLVAGVAAAVVVAVVLILPAPPVAPPPAVAVTGPAGGCNGSRSLCARRLDEVAFPATHNSYAAADEPGWLFPNQRFGIERQLRDGIRGLLVDIHYGERDPRSGIVRTDLEAEGSDRNKVKRELSPMALRTAERLAGRAGLGATTGNPEPYMCHTLCELGAEPLDEQFKLIKDFLDAHRGEVVVMFVEPYVPVAEIERSLRRTGLLDQAAELQRDEPLPTLGDLVRANTRLVILAEKDGGSRAWYLPGFSFAQDTPLGATNAAELRCDRFRGTPDSPLFLVNHWIDTFPPSVSRNQRIGGRVLRRRLDRCARERRLTPNLIAVDFYERTGVVGIAQRRNRRAATAP